MLESEKKIKIKVRSRGTVFRNFAYIRNYVQLKSYAFEEMRLSNIFKTINVKKLTMAILESSYGVLQVTSEWKTLKKLSIFKAVEFFDIEISVNMEL